MSEKASHGNKGKIRTEATRTKLREAAIGRVFSEEAKAKISALHRGKVISEETRARMCAAQRGRVVSDETRAKLSEARLRTVLAKKAAQLNPSAPLATSAKEIPKAVEKKVTKPAQSISQEEEAAKLRLLALEEKAKAVEARLKLLEVELLEKLAALEKISTNGVVGKTKLLQIERDKKREVRLRNKAAKELEIAKAKEARKAEKAEIKEVKVAEANRLKAIRIAKTNELKGLKDTDVIATDEDKKRIREEVSLKVAELFAAYKNGTNS